MSKINDLSLNVTYFLKKKSFLPSTIRISSKNGIFPLVFRIFKTLIHHLCKRKRRKLSPTLKLVRNLDSINKFSTKNEQKFVSIQLRWKFNCLSLKCLLYSIWITFAAIKFWHFIFNFISYSFIFWLYKLSYPIVCYSFLLFFCFCFVYLYVYVRLYNK